MARIGLASLGMIGLGAIGAVLLSAFGQAAPSAPPPSPAPAPVTGTGTPILVELFTSEGCSSCPSADAVATKLERTQPVAGARIIVLAHHVDYWNSLGWPDPWSSSAATARQRSYAPLHAGSYTPQAVIDGRTETVGSRGSLVESMVADAAKAPHLAVDVDVTRFEKNVFDVNVKVGGATPSDTDVLIAVVQDRGRTAVPAGENAGRTLDHTSIVRTLATGPKARVSIPAAVNAPDGTTFSIVGFVQERASRKILGSNAARVP
jgi:hypothetical protein